MSLPRMGQVCPARLSKSRPVSPRGAWLRLCVTLVLLTGCGSPPPPSPTAAVEVESPAAYLREVSEVQFSHSSGDLEAFAMAQIMGSGTALFDFDNDGDLDILLIDGGMTPDSASDAPPVEHPVGKLLRQDDGNAWTDITSASGLVHRGYGMGCAVGDINNDGDLDLYLTSYGEDRLFANQGGGKFLDVTDEAGIANPKWGTAASFFDFDQDGWLDLLVVNYLDYFPGSVCEDGRGRRDYCGPQSFSGTVSKLYRNLGTEAAGNAEARFADVTVASGFAVRAGRGLGAICRDFNGDRRPDIFVANDMQGNCLWIQQEDHTFRDEAVLRGVALNRLGESEANMGVIGDDLDGDGLFDLLVTHLSGETNTLYCGDRSGMFIDKTAASGLGAPSFPLTGFGVVAADLQHDGCLDIVVVNGKVKRGASDVPAGASRDHWGDYAEPNQVYLGDGRGNFVIDEKLGGSLFSTRREVSRGLACGDVDNDGDLDLLVTNCGGPARLYRNEFPKQGHWLGVRVLDPDLKRDAIGARVTIRCGERTVTREVAMSSSYLSSNDPRVHFGLGTVGHYDSIEVDWPTGKPGREVFPGGPADRYLVLTRREGKPINGESSP